MYGLTECKRVSYLPPRELDRRPESVGIPIPNEEVWIVDDDGNKLGPNQKGELVVRGSNVMQGYWNDPEETARRYRKDPEGRGKLLYTGDIFRKDEDGYLYFISRKDDLLKTKGERVSPKEIEACLHDLEGIAEAAVIGVPDDILGQAIKAFIVTDRQVELTETLLMKYCQQNLEPFMVPKYIEFRDALPKSPNGKIDKKMLKESA
jgi:acyl-coenzyme A synthetase/AMP-(fatty) acid ligase